MKFNKSILLAGVAAVLLTTAALAQVSLPVVQSVGPTDKIQVVPNGSPVVGNVYAYANQIGAEGSPPRTNVIIGGDATTNLWQRGTAGVSTTSATPAYDSADRWAQWTPSAAAGVKIARDSTAADLPPSYLYALALTHTNTTGGSICMGQEVLSTNAIGLQSQTVELDFHAATGAGLSAASPYNLTASIITGTVADEGISAMAGGTWTGQANASAAVIPLGGVSTNNRYVVVANIPAAAKEIGVQFCYTAGTTDTNDYVAFSGVQLVRSPGLSNFVSTTLGYNMSAPPPGFVATPFIRRLASQEANLQYAYFWEINETAVGGAAAGVAVSPSGQGAAATSCTVLIPTPVTMRAVPSLNFTLNGNAPSASTWTVTHVVTASALSTPFLAASAAASTPNLLALTATTGSVLTAGQTCILTTTAAGGGVINASAEL